MDIFDNFADKVNEFMLDCVEEGIDIGKEVGNEICDAVLEGVFMIDTDKEGKDEEEKVKLNRNLKKGNIPIGEAVNHFGSPAVYYPDNHNRHLKIRGATDTGKTTLGVNLAVHKASNGEGLAFMCNDDGKSVDRILKMLPESELDRVVLLDHSDTRYPLPLGDFRKTDDYFLNDKIMERWIKLFEDHFCMKDMYSTQNFVAKAIKSIFELEEGNMYDVIRLAQEEEYREYVKNKLTDETLINYWDDFSFSKLNGADAFLRRASQIFERERYLKYTFACDSVSEIDYRKWMDQGKIVLIKMPESLGENIVNMLATIHINKLWRAILSRDDIPESQRRQFMFFSDEPQTWLNSSNADRVKQMFSKSRKYGVSLSLMFQSNNNITGISNELMNIIIDNCPDRVYFQTNSVNEDLKPHDVSEIPIHHCVYKPRNHDPVLLNTFPPLDYKRNSIKKIKDKFRVKYNLNYTVADRKIRERRKTLCQKEANIKEKKSELPKTGSQTSANQDSPVEI